ncbi:hypothetical protein OCU04_004211 [Sclerotinia nivalis]|uniref:Uncharacterized protein n=1 Tax=Sclerotinia nivalis TaxID=352851 RepID=A0A9X0DKX3_9HELO|nr:hypothetical protein OCU04_004211 [Sclerotinia nivalis]
MIFENSSTSAGSRLNARVVKIAAIAVIWDRNTTSSSSDSSSGAAALSFASIALVAVRFCSLQCGNMDISYDVKSMYSTREKYNILLANILTTARKTSLSIEMTDNWGSQDILLAGLCRTLYKSVPRHH